MNMYLRRQHKAFRRHEPAESVAQTTRRHQTYVLYRVSHNPLLITTCVHPFGKFLRY